LASPLLVVDPPIHVATAETSDVVLASHQIIAFRLSRVRLLEPWCREGWGSLRGV